MRYAVIHCPNQKCRLKIWVPSHELGVRGRCPNCGQRVHTPAFVPPEELQQGPAFLQEIEHTEEPVAGVV